MHSQHSVFLRLLYSSQDYWSNTNTGLIHRAMAHHDLLVPYRSPWKMARVDCFDDDDENDSKARANDVCRMRPR